MGTEMRNRCTVNGPGGEQVVVDQWGNNAALICRNCGGPVLVHPKRVGEKSPPESAECEGCGQNYTVDWDTEKRPLVITYIGLA